MRLKAGDSDVHFTLWVLSLQLFANHVKNLEYFLSSFSPQ